MASEHGDPGVDAHDAPSRSTEDASNDDGMDRRGFLSRFSGVVMGIGLLAAYGSFGRYALRFLSPPPQDDKRWMFVARADEIEPGASVPYTAPSGETVNITRQGEGETAADFVALSSTCPHLGCQVHWESQNVRFFCPCHNGVFDPAGQPVSGPPADANQSLPEYPLRVEDGLLFIEVPTESLTAAHRPAAARRGQRA